jgi:hypothetical protein
VILAAMVAADWLRRKPRWGLYAAVVAAWVAFGAWVPSARHQLKSISGGVYTPEGYLNVGIFLDDLALQTPLALVLGIVVLLGTLALLSARPCLISEEACSCSASSSWAALGLLALALMGVPLGTWAASHVLYPPPYMLRYIFPVVAAWVLITAMILMAIHRLPRPSGGPMPPVPPWVCTLAWGGVLVFCILYHTREKKSRPAGGSLRGRRFRPQKSPDRF